MNMNTSEYTKQSHDFLEKTNTSVVISFSHKGKHFPGDKQERNIYSVTIKNRRHAFMFPFGDSIANTENYKRPTSYDILTCLTKYEPEETLNEFAESYGYKNDPELAIRIYNAVKEEWSHVKQLWTEEELELLREIT